MQNRYSTVEAALIKYAHICPDCHEQFDERAGFNAHWCVSKQKRYSKRPTKIHLIKLDEEWDSCRATVYIYFPDPVGYIPLTIDNEPTWWRERLIYLAGQVSGIVNSAHCSRYPGDDFLNRPLVRAVGRRVIVSQFGGKDI